MIVGFARLKMTSVNADKAKKVVHFDPEQARCCRQPYKIRVAATFTTVADMYFRPFAYALDLFKLDHDLPLFFGCHRFFTVVIKSVRFTDHLAG